jgi:hypothetical protein
MPRKLFIITMILAAGAIACDRESGTVEGKGDTALTLTVPEDVSIQRGQMKKIDISIEREDLDGNVAIEFANLPEGVEVTDADKEIVGDEGSYTLKASQDADLVSGHEVMITAKAGEVSIAQPMMIEVTQAD